MLSVCYFKREGLVLCLYVDDLTLTGRTETHPAFWLGLSKRVELEPFAPLTRIRGRTLGPVWFEDKPALSLGAADFSPGNVSSFTYPSLSLMSNLRPRVSITTCLVSCSNRGEVAVARTRSTLQAKDKFGYCQP